ncbi:MAG: EF-hand domain-containing protein [Verrucomicrobiales bacterium]
MKTNTLTLAVTFTTITSLITGSLMAREDGPGKGRKGPKGRPGKEMVEKFDADGDGTLSESEKETARTAAKARMEAADTNGDGTLSEGERVAALKKRLAANENLSARLLKRFDADESGDLSDAELAKASKTVGKRRGGKGPKGKRGPKGGGKRGPKKSPTS